MLTFKMPILFIVNWKVNKMIKFYLRIQNKMLTPHLLSIVTLIILLANLTIRIFPVNFISLPQSTLNNKFIARILPTSLFTYCDVYLLMLFIILIFFFLGTDYDNSMEDIALASGGSKTNKLFIRKLAAIGTLYFVLYTITFTNIYTLYLKLIYGKGVLIPLKEILIYSFTTNLFVFSLSLFILFLSRNISISISIITAYYLIEEALWRCKISQTKGILGHLYQYSDYKPGEIYSVKIIYVLVAFILLFLSYKISKRKLNLRRLKCLKF